MDSLLVRATYIVFGLIVIGIGGHAVIWPDKMRKGIQSRQVVQSTKDAMESPIFTVFTCLGGVAFVAFGANMIFKALTAP